MPPSDSEEILLDDPREIDPYDVLSVPATASDNDIKKAYRKLALKHHPDKGGSHASFQTLAFAYSILSTPSRRSLYDATGSLQPPDPVSSGFNWRDFYREQHRDVISDASIAAFRAEYKGSDEEKHDLLAVFAKNKGDMRKVYEEVMLSDPVEDEERFRGIIDAAIDAGTAEGWPKYVKETKRQRERRIKAAGKEEAEARELAQELGIGDVKKGGEEALKALIVKRSRESQQGFLERLEAKYGAVGKKGQAKPKGKKRPPPSDEDEDEAEEAAEEPPEAAFQAMAARAAKKQKDSTPRRPPRTAAIGTGGRAPRKGRPKA